MIFATGQASSSKSDGDQITGLMAALSSHSKTPADVLDPTLDPVERKKNLGHFSSSPYELNIFPTDALPAITGDSASVPIQVHYKAEDGNSLDSSATAEFVRRNGIWYFSNFAFMGWPALLLAVLFAGVFVGIGYAATVLILRTRLVKQGIVGPNSMAKMFIPFFWPSLFRQTR
ncbi:MAG: hypothetical protein ABR910_07005 [Acidobacteriaceae bacterium]|jgi:hypothetical protein